MNYRMIIYMMGKMLGVEGVLLLIPCLVSAVYREETWLIFFATAVSLLLLSLLLSFRRPKNNTIYAKEGFVIVAKKISQVSSR